MRVARDVACNIAHTASAAADCPDAYVPWPIKLASMGLAVVAMAAYGYYRDFYKGDYYLDADRCGRYRLRRHWEQDLDGCWPYKSDERLEPYWI